MTTPIRPERSSVAPEGTDLTKNVFNEPPLSAEEMRAVAALTPEQKRLRDEVLRLRREGSDSVSTEFAAKVLRGLRENVLPSPAIVERVDSPLSRAPLPFGLEQSPLAEANIGIPGTRFNIGFSLNDLLRIPDNLIIGSVNKIASALGFGVTEEEPGAFKAGDRPIRITDPTVPLEQVQEFEPTEDELRARNFNRFLLSSFFATKNFGQGGILKAYQDGSLAPPDGETERLAAFAGQALFDMGVSIPLVVALSAATPVGLGIVAETSIGDTTIGAIGKRIIQSLTKKYSSDVATRVVQEAATMLARTSVETELGLALGGLHVMEQLRAGEDLSPADAVKEITLYGAAGLAFGAVSSAFHGVGIRRSLSRWERTILSGPSAGLEVGTSLRMPDGSVMELVGKGNITKAGTREGRWKWIVPPEGKKAGSFAKRPTAEEVSKSIRAMAEREETITARSAQIQAVPPTVPGLDAEEQAVQTMAAAWVPAMQERALSIPREEFLAEMQMMARQALDMDLPRSTRVAYLGRARAIQAVLGELEPLAGVTPIELERAALEIVAANAGSPSAALRMAADAGASGNPVLEARIAEIVAQGLPDQQIRRVNTLVEQGRAVTNRGLAKGSIVRKVGGRHGDGGTYRLVSDPAVGTARAQQVSRAGAGTRGDFSIIALDDAIIRPRGGETVLLKTGQVGDILSARGGTDNTIVVKLHDGTQATFAFDAVAEVGDHPLVARMHKQAIRRARNPKRAGVQRTIPAVGMTPEGEVGTVVGQGPNGTVIRTRNGRERVIANVLATKETATTGDLQILGFAPGTRPDPGNHILFFDVPTTQAAAFEAAYNAGKPVAEFLRGGVHVLPPRVSGQGTVLYAVELPEIQLPNRVYTTAAKKARRIVSQGGSGRLTTYQTPVQVDPALVGRHPVMRVPESLHARVMLPESELAALRGTARRDYLRRLLDFADDVNTPIAQAATKMRTAGERAVRAAVDNDAKAHQEATQQRVSAVVEAVEAHAQEAWVQADRQVAEIRQRMVTENPQGNQVVQAALAGDRTALLAIVNRGFHEGVEPLLIHGEIPGRTLALRPGDENSVIGVIREAGEEYPIFAVDNIPQALEQANTFGFRGGLYVAEPPGAFELLGNPSVRAIVDDAGNVRMYVAERLSQTSEVVWRLDSVGRVDVAQSTPVVGEFQLVEVGSLKGRRIFSVHDPEGNLTDVTVTAGPSIIDPTKLDVSVGGPGAGALGTAGARQLQRQLVERFPGVESIVGVRETGSRTISNASKTASQIARDTAVDVPIVRRRRFVPPPGFIEKPVTVVARTPWEVGPAQMLGADAQPLFGGPPGRALPGPTPGRLFAPEAPPWLRVAQEAAQREGDRIAWGPIHAQLVHSTPVGTPGGDLVLAKYHPSGSGPVQTVRIISAKPGEPNVTVELGKGGTLDVSKDLVDPVTLKNGIQDWRLSIAGDEAGTAYEAPLTLPVGLGQLEKELGLQGVTQPVIVRDAAVELAGRRLRELSISDGQVLGSPEAVESLLQTYDRALDLGFEGDILRLIPDDARPMFLEAAYERTRNRIPNEEYGLLYAGAKYGKLVPQQIEVLKEIARDHNLSSSLAPHRVAEDLWNRRLIDPNMAKWTLDYRRDLGMVRTAQEVNLDPSFVKLTKRPSRGTSWYATQWLNPSYFEMRKNPMSQAFEAAVRHANEVAQQSERALAEWGLIWQRQQRLTMPDGTTRKVKTADLDLAWNLRRDHGTWEQAVKAGAVEANDPRHVLYTALTTFFDARLERLIRLQLQLGVKAIKLASLPENVQEQFLFDHPWIGRPKGDYFITPSQLQRTSTEGLVVRRSVHPEEEIDSFMGLLRDHETVETLPSGAKPWMREEFELWKRFGREDYAPLIHEGDFSVELRSNDGWEKAGFATSFPDAIKLVEQYRREGNIPRDREFRIKLRKAWADDIIQDTMSSKELFTWLSSLRGKVIADNEAINGMLVPGAKPKVSPVAGKPIRGPLAERTSALEPPTQHAWQLMQIYDRRLARLEQRHAVAKAYNTYLNPRNPAARRLDDALANLEGRRPLFDDPKMLRYAEDFAEDAIGIETGTERVVNATYAFMQMLTRGSAIYARSKVPRLWQRFLNGEDVTLPAFGENGVFNTDNWRAFGAAKARASELIAFQAQWRMAFGPAQVLTNATQYHLFTVPFLRKNFGFRAAWHARGSWLTAFRIYKAQVRGKPLTGRLARMAKIAEAAGATLQAGQHLTGTTTLSSTVETALHRPTTFGLNSGQKAAAYVDWLGLYMFNGAERVNRVATAIATYEASRFPKARGGLTELSHDAAIAKAKDVIANTQFLYDPLNLPQFMRRGPIGGSTARVLLQFKPFLINATRYEINMATDAARGIKNGDMRPALAAANHAALYAVYGGARGVVNHPLLAGTLGVFGLIPGIEGNRALQAKAASLFKERDEDSLPAQVGKRVALDGVPGLLRLSMGNRLTNGQEIASLGTMLNAGPYFSTVLDFDKAAFKFITTQEGPEAFKAKLALGAAFFTPEIASVIVGGGRGLSAIPFSRLAAAGLALPLIQQGLEKPEDITVPRPLRGLLGRNVVSPSALIPRVPGVNLGAQSWVDWLNNSPEGRTFMQRFTATAVRNGQRAFQLYQHGFYRDNKLHKIEVPYNQRGTEALAMMGGFPTTRTENRRTYIEWIRSKAYTRQATKQQLVRSAAVALTSDAPDDRERYWDILRSAGDLGIQITPEDIAQQVKRLNTTQVQAIIQAIDRRLRGEKP